MDIAHKETDVLLEKLEKRLNREYKQAKREVQAKLDKYLERFKKKDSVMKAKVDAGKITAKDYAKWRTSQIMVGVRWENMRDTLANDYHNTNMIAKSITREHMPEVYALNHNYGTYEIEKGTSLGTSYTLYDRNTVEHILRENPDLLPEPGKATSARIAEGLDVRWNRQQIQSVMLQGILQGESIPNLAKRLANQVGDSNRKSAIRNARTMTTRAQNYGRLDSYKRATGLGIKMKKQWVATLDHRTRDSHVDVDGEIRDVNQTFSNGLDCPGGMGPPEEVYNCRCTMIAQLKGFENDITDPKVRSVEGLGGMSYKEWKAAHSKPLKTIVKLCKEAKIEYNKFDKLPKKLSTDALIDKIGRLDKMGQCVSQVCAYIGNKMGYDIEDMRGGKTAEIFAKRSTALTLFTLPGADGLLISNKSDFKAVVELSKHVEPGKEYVLFTANHMSVIRKGAKGLEFLELQEKKGENGFKLLTYERLKSRFDCEKQRDKEWVNGLVDVQKLGTTKDFINILGYVNSKRK